MLIQIKRSRQYVEFGIKNKAELDITFKKQIPAFLRLGNIAIHSAKLSYIKHCRQAKKMFPFKHNTC